MKVLFLVNIPSPYRVQFFDELGSRCDLTVLYERRSATNRDPAWGSGEVSRHSYREIYLNGLRVGAESALAPQALKHLLDKRYDVVVVGGYSTPTGAMAVACLKALRRPFVLSVDGGYISADDALRRRVKRFLIGAADSWLSTGRGADDYLAHYGAVRERCFTYPFSSVRAKDVARCPATPAEKRLLRAELGISHEKVVLSVGRFLGWKGFDLLIRAAARFPAGTGLYIVGGKPPQEYVSLVEENALSDRVRFVDFQQSAILRNYYRAADLFATATRDDIWGLVVNEAMAQGLPVISTDRCGAAQEMIEDGRNGRVVPVDDMAAFATAVNELLNDDEMRECCAQRALETGASYTIESMALAHLDFFERVWVPRFGRQSR